MNIIRLSALIAGLVLSMGAALGQSTFGSILGTVRDSSGGALSTCVVTIQNTGTSAKRAITTDQNGSYNIPNVEPGTYKVTMEAPGFQIANYANVELLARQTVRLDGAMTVATLNESVNVTAEAAPVINTEVSNIAETKTGRELVDLPIAITSRSTGLTSPLSTLTTQPGVQTDANGAISVAGIKPSMLSISIDGISSMGPRSSAPLAELFPSFNSIAEIRVSEVNNSAEFGGISDITTISKSGTNKFHGGLYENLENTVMNARNPFSTSVPITKMNDFGVYVGGPISIPKLYHGQDRTFFFLGYEGLRLPKQTVVVESVPSLALRDGNLSAYSKAVLDPLTPGVPFPNNLIPIARISPLSLNVLKYLFPLPNTGSPNAIANNYVQNFPTPITSNQGDLRLDQTINSRQTVFSRMTYKRRGVQVAPVQGGTVNGSALLGPFSLPEVDFGITVAHNFVISPSLVNEIRAGYTGVNTATTFGISPSTIADQLGLVGLPPYPSGAAVPNFAITGFQQTGGNSSRVSRQNTLQFLDNLTWNRNGHSVKFGGDYRFMNGLSTNVYAPQRLGVYTFNNAVTGSLIGNPYGAFMLGIPDKTQLNTVNQPDSDGYAKAYAFYVQDDWKVTSHLTLNYGLRWEYHPMFDDRLVNGTNFLPDYSSIVNGVRINGATVISNQAALAILNADYAASTAPTPILTAAQAGIPESLRYSQKTDFSPRFGFAWRPFANGKTVVRGGYGRFIQGSLGALLGAAYAIHSANQAFYNQSIVNGQPTLTFPYPFPAKLAQPGTQFFQQAGDVHFKDPTVDQWNLTIEKDLGFGMGLRLSYNGSHGNELGRQGNFDQLAPNTTGFKAGSPLLLYPLFGLVQGETNGGRSNYHAFAAVVNKRLSKGVQFQSSYTFLRNLTNAQGYNPNSFASEAGGLVTDLRDKQIDYGNVAFSRRHRFLTTFLYQLPFGAQGTILKNKVLDQVVGGWELAGVLLYQSGPFLTVTVPGADPSGTGFPLLIGNGRADIVSGVNPYAAVQTPQQWLNPAAFAVPGNNIGRYPTAPVGNLVGPGTQAISLSLTKTIKVTETVKFQFGGQAANLLNQVNYAPPATTFNTATYGTISNVQAAEGAGPRQLQVTARFMF